MITDKEIQVWQVTFLVYFGLFIVVFLIIEGIRRILKNKKKKKLRVLLVNDLLEYLEESKNYRKKEGI